ncbi:MAG: membrane protein of unknown function [Promethearchaeota archaeon]|nr:MAG: membrane protein of unknown function [Candidatus Lokiarchaeota archaeon]
MKRKFLYVQIFYVNRSNMISIKEKYFSYNMTSNEDVAKILGIIGAVIGIVDAVLDLAGQGRISGPIELDFLTLEVSIGIIVALIISVIALVVSLPPQGLLMIIMGILMIILASFLGGILVLVGGIVALID